MIENCLMLVWKTKMTTWWSLGSRIEPSISTHGCELFWWGLEMSISGELLSIDNELYSYGIALGVGKEEHAGMQCGDWPRKDWEHLGRGATLQGNLEDSSIPSSPRVEKVWHSWVFLFCRSPSFPPLECWNTMLKDETFKWSLGSHCLFLP